ncbi:hypothetical protein V2J09_019313 [Rumex salicifolius]
MMQLGGGGGEPISAHNHLLLSGADSDPPTVVGINESPLRQGIRRRRRSSSDSAAALKPIRSYRRSEVPRLRWGDDLHHQFVHAVDKLGGPDRATPKMIMNSMEVEGITIAHVKSHLQLYRSIKQEELIQDVLVKAKAAGSKSGEVRVLAEMPSYVAGRRGVSRRHVRLERLKALLAAATANEAALGGPNSCNVAVVMPEQTGRRSHSYILFKDILSATSTPTEKGRANLAAEDPKNKEAVDVHTNWEHSGASSNSTLVIAAASSSSMAAAPYENAVAFPGPRVDATSISLSSLN